MQEAIFVIISVVTHSAQTPQIYPSQFSHHESSIYDSMEECENWLRTFAVRNSNVRIGIDHDNSMYAEDVLLPVHLRCVKIERK